MEEMSRREAIRLMGVGALTLSGICLAGCSGAASGGAGSRTKDEATVYTPASLASTNGMIGYFLSDVPSDRLPAKDDSADIWYFHDGIVDIYHDNAIVLGDVADSTDDEMLTRFRTLCEAGGTSDAGGSRHSFEGGVLKIEAKTDDSGNRVVSETIDARDFASTNFNGGWGGVMRIEDIETVFNDVQIHEATFGGFRCEEVATANDVLLFRMPDDGGATMVFQVDVDPKTEGLTVIDD